MRRRCFSTFRRASRSNEGLPFDNGPLQTASLGYIGRASRNSFKKYSVQDLLDLESLSGPERFRVAYDALCVGVPKMFVCLQDMPLGFSRMEPIRGVLNDYVESLRDLDNCNPEKDFAPVIASVFTRHKGIMSQIAQGLHHFQEEVASQFEPFADYDTTHCADMAESVSSMRRIERGLDEFFTTRLTLRLLIKHCIEMTGGSVDMDASPFSGSLFRQIQNDELHRSPHFRQEEHVGAVCMKTHPVLILGEAFQQAQKMSLRDFGAAPRLQVNGVDSVEFFSKGHDDPSKQTSFPYVGIHLYYILFEVLKNAIVTSMRKAEARGVEPTPICVSMLMGSSLDTENERTIKIADAGEGILREELPKAFSYFYSTNASFLYRSIGSATDPLQTTTRSDFSKGAPLAYGRGLGLPVSRVLARYFGGEIDLHSIPRVGTDVYIYL